MIDRFLEMDYSERQADGAVFDSSVGVFSRGRTGSKASRPAETIIIC